MLSLPSSVRVYAALGATDMRKSFDTLAEEVRRVIEEDPLSGALFVFCNRARNRIKVLYFDRGGYWLIARRLERGTFAWPKEGARRKIALRADDLVLVLNGRIRPAKYTDPVPARGGPAIDDQRCARAASQLRGVSSATRSGGCVGRRSSTSRR